VPAVPVLKEAAPCAPAASGWALWLADLIVPCRAALRLSEGQEFAAQVMEFIRYHSMQTSVELAETRGVFRPSWLDLRSRKP